MPLGNVCGCEGYSIDSRTMGPGELFFAVRGERLDGHDYVLGALEEEPRARWSMCSGAMAFRPGPGPSSWPSPTRSARFSN